MEDHLEYVVNLLDSKKKAAPNGSPMWSARDVMTILGYRDWRSFKEVIEKARVACDNSGRFSGDHFVQLPDMVGIGSGAMREMENIVLSKYACYLVAMNGESKKLEVATAQTYFAIQTHRQESQELLSEEERRLLLRDRVKDANKKLSGAARDAGVTNSKFGIFHDAGYKGLYDGLGVRDIKKAKGIDGKDDLLDRIGRAELAANEFRITQTEQKLRNEAITGEQTAIDTHHRVGVQVRTAIKEIGGTMPEKLPPEPSIRKLAAAKVKEERNRLKTEE